MGLISGLFHGFFMRLMFGLVVEPLHYSFGLVGGGGAIMQEVGGVMELREHFQLVIQQL
jgi:hypothetical protein